jgi:para-aminobenzoate synthetase component 1
LNQISEPPFATFLKIDDHFALSASPERYLAKKGNRLISQHIKETLKNDPKERSENIMIVDLVRNDLSRIADRGSVSVPELCGIYTFKQVHQLISTITCTVSDSISPSKILENTYPMGSMTGAPKISAMKTIEANEDAKRGLYSGSIGYISPEGEFDFNVVIRTILYNSLKHYVSYSVGGAITSRSIPDKEYEECLIKAKAMKTISSHHFLF